MAIVKNNFIIFYIPSKIRKNIFNIMCQKKIKTILFDLLWKILN